MLALLLAHVHKYLICQRRTERPRSLCSLCLTREERRKRGNGVLDFRNIKVFARGGGITRNKHGNSNLPHSICLVTRVISLIDKVGKHLFWGISS